MAPPDPTTNVTKALTVDQPHIGLLAHEIRHFETRPFPPNGSMRPDGFRGYPGLTIDQGERIALHASSSLATGAEWSCAWDRLAAAHCAGRTAHWAPKRAVLATAAVLGAGMFVDGTTLTGPTDHPVLEVYADDDVVAWRPDGSSLHVAAYFEGEVSLGICTPGRWGWLLGDVERLAEPVSCRGAQGVWRLPDSVSEALR
jgi:hypothetical protein